MFRSAAAQPQGPGLSRSAEATEENVKQNRRQTTDCRAQRTPGFQFSSSTKRTTGPGTMKPSYGATNLGGHWDDRIRRHAAV